MKRVKGVAEAVAKIVSRRGIGYLVNLLVGHFVPKVGYDLLCKITGLRKKKLIMVVLAVGVWAALRLVCGKLKSLLVASSIATIVVVIKAGIETCKFTIMRYRARALAKRIGSGNNPPNTFTSWRQLSVDSATRAAVDAARVKTRELVIGHIDGDGKVLSLYGPLSFLPMVNTSDFAPRARYRLDVVLVGDNVLIRKDYWGDKRAFLREWYASLVLNGIANVPAVYHADEHRCLLYRNLIVGKTVREVLVDAGAKILHSQTYDDLELAELSPSTRIEAILTRGTEFISRCLSTHFLLELEAQIQRAHSVGVTGLSCTFGNIVRDETTDQPWFIDLEGTRIYKPPKGLLFRLWRDRDLTKVNKLYNRSVMTESSAARILSALGSRGAFSYAPVDFGGGVAVGSFWSTDNGTGRWEYINGNILAPLIKGRRVLDLGSNNGVMPMLMLRAGARQVLGLELSAEYVEAAHLVHRLFEWRDMRKYDFQIRNCDMLEITRGDIGRFDIVTALCTLYYLEVNEMACVVQRAAQLAPMMIIQANVSTRSSAANMKALKSSVAFLRRLLEKNGFSQVEVFAPPGYSRPLLVARVSDTRLADASVPAIT